MYNLVIIIIFKEEFIVMATIPNQHLPSQVQPAPGQPINTNGQPVSTLPPTFIPKKREPSMVGNALWTGMKIGQATALAVAGVALISFGAYSAHKVYTEADEYFFADESSGNGLGSIPYFESACNKTCNFLHDKLSYPEKDSIFCTSVANNSFDKLDDSMKAPGLIIPCAAATLGAFGSLYCSLGGVALLYTSVEVFTSTVFGRQA